MKKLSAKWLLLAGVIGPGLALANDDLKPPRGDTTVAPKSEQMEPTKLDESRGQGGAAQAGMMDAQQTEVLAKLHDVNQHEIMMGNLARDKAMSRDVKKYGERLVKDHEGADKKVSALAAKHNVVLADAEPKSDEWTQEKAKDAQAMADLQKLTGMDFDRQFLTDMIQGHDKVIAMVAEVKASQQNAELNKLLDDLLPSLKRHRDDANSLVGKLDKKAAARRPPAGTMMR